MFSLAEAARLKQDGHLLRESTSKSHPFEFDDGPRRKKRKGGTTGMSDDEFLEMKRALPMQKGNQVHAFKDVVEMGICTVEKARELYDLYVLSASGERY